MKKTVFLTIALIALLAWTPTLADSIDVQTHVKVELQNDRGVVFSESTTFPGRAPANYLAAVSFADEVIGRSGYATREGGGELRCGTMAYNKQGEPLDCLTNHPCVDCYELIIVIPPGS